MNPFEAFLRAQKTRFGRVIAAARFHLPWWLSAVIAIALAIPGPQDEILVGLLVGAAALFMPEMRADIRFAWGSIYHRESWIRHAK